MNNNLPDFLKPFLWSYNFSKLEKETDKNTIIKNILNFGTKESTDWLFSNYKISEIKEIFQKSNINEWNKKSLNFWSLIFNIKPEKNNRF